MTGLRPRLPSSSDYGQRPRRYAPSCEAQEALLPRREAGEIWQAGVTPDSDLYKVLFNGEPMPGIVAAGKDWVLLLPEPAETDVDPGPRAPLGKLELSDPFTQKRRLTGRVQIVHLDGRPIKGQ